MTPDEERRLAKAAAKGDESAFEALVLDNQKRVYNLALKLTGNPDDAFDVSQEAFLSAYKNLGSFRFDCRFSVWLYRLAYNEAMDFLKKNRVPGLVSLTGEDGGDIETFTPDSAPLPEEAAERNDTRRLVREAVARLPEDKREIIVMREFSGMSYGAIAEALGIEEGTVKSRLARARKNLAEILIKSGTFPEPKQSKDQKGGSSDDL